MASYVAPFGIIELPDAGGDFVGPPGFITAPSTATGPAFNAAYANATHTPPMQGMS